MQQYSSHATLADEAERISIIRQKSHKLNDKTDLEPLFDRIGDARIVMLGEASHGTHEYYTWRAHISKRLIEERGFNFIAVEGDWPDCYRLNRFVKGYDEESSSAFNVLHAFNRWPTWMWANWEISSLADWLHLHNTGLAANKKTGFYGLDVYSLWESMESIMRYLRKVDPAALKVAQNALKCFEPYRRDEGRSYAEACMFVPALCQNDVVALLKEIRLKVPQYNSDHENVFSTEQNALIAVNAERYYRAMIEGGPHSWNVRDQHMADTLDRLLTFHGDNSKAIVWEHNTHIGDARATDMVNEGMINIGELARIKYQNKNVVLVGFGSYQGTVIAGRSWGDKMQVMDMPEARKGSWEFLMHKAGEEDKLLLMNDLEDVSSMKRPIDHRAIGVVYNSRHERYGNYVPTILPRRYDAFIYLDQTRALNSLHIQPDGSQIPETYPFGI